MSPQALAGIVALWTVLAISNRAAQGEEPGLNGRLMSLIARHGPVAPPGLTLVWRWRDR